MIGSLWATIYILGLEQIGGIKNLLLHENVVNKISLTSTTSVILIKLTYSVSQMTTNFIR